MRKTNGLRTTGDGLENINETHDFELMLQRTYKHMIERMHKDLLQLRLKLKNSKRATNPSKLSLRKKLTKTEKQSNRDYRPSTGLKS